MTTPAAQHVQRWGDDRGQALLLVAVATMALIGMAAFTVDVGYALNARKQLQTSVDAAATAAAQDLWQKSRTEVTSTALRYSANPGQKNAYSNLPGVSTTVAFKCLTTIGLPTPCTNPAAANAITVTSTTTLPMFLAQTLGINTMQIRASATSVMKGGGLPPLDIMIVLDATGSMSGNCSAPVTGVSNPKRLDCAKAGLRSLIGSLWPCSSSLANCGAATNGRVVNPIDEVGLAIFPGLTSAALAVNERDCSDNLSGSTAAYNASPVYVINGLASDYRASTSATALSNTSNLVNAVYWKGAGGACGGTNAPGTYGIENHGGVGSFFADAITAAQSTLVATGRADVQNVIIFVSDGETSTNPPPTGVNGCQKAINAAAAATAAGTWVYSIAYESPTGAISGCGGLSARRTMELIASDTTKFYNQPTSGDLTGIFQKVAADLTTSRLVPDDAQ